MTRKKSLKISPVHPGEVLLKDFIEPLQMSQNRLAISLGVPARRINEIVHGRRAVTADTALRLSKYFGTTAKFWLNMQTSYELELQKDKNWEEIDKIVLTRAK